MAAILGALLDLSTKTTVLKAGWLEVTVANLVVLVLVVVVFALGLWIQLPGRRRREAP